MEALWQFQKQAGLRNFHFDTRDGTLRAQHTDTQMELALILKAIARPEQQKTGCAIF